jgi:hypothetical protein
MRVLQSANLQPVPFAWQGAFKERQLADIDASENS